MFQKVFDFFVYYDKDAGSFNPTTAGNISLFIVVLLLFIAMAAFSGYKTKTRVKQLAFCAMALTLTVVTSYIKFASLPFGGSVTLFSMFFICLIGYLYGTKAGVLTGIAYGFINLILGPYVVHPVQLLLDYPIAFGCLGLAGVFSNKKYGIIKGYLLGVVGRYICHVISGYIFFASYAPKGMNPMVYSLGYNLTYIAPEALATILILMVVPVRNALLEVKKLAAENYAG